MAEHAKYSRYSSQLPRWNACRVACAGGLFNTIRMAWSGLLKNFLFVVGGIVSALLLAELLFFILNSQPTTSITATTSVLPAPDEKLQQPVEFFDYHPIFGLAGIPGAHGILDGKSFTHNSAGFRGKEIAIRKEPDSHRVVMLGDSQVWGWGTEEQETIWAYLDSQLHEKRPAQKWDVANFGVSGFGTDQELLQYLLLGRRYQPDVVVLVVFKENDLQEVGVSQMWGVAKPYFSLQDGRLCPQNIPPPRSNGWPGSALLKYDQHSDFAWILAHSQTIQFFRQRDILSSVLDLGVRWGLSNGISLSGAKLELQRIFGCLNTGQAIGSDGTTLFLALVEELSKRASIDGAKFLVALKPTGNVYWQNRYDREYEDALAGLRARNIAVIDLAARWKSQQAEAGVLFQGGDHLTAVATRDVALAISDWILTNDSKSEHDEEVELRQLTKR